MGKMLVVRCMATILTNVTNEEILEVTNLLQGRYYRRFDRTSSDGVTDVVAR